MQTYDYIKSTNLPDLTTTVKQTTYMQVNMCLNTFKYVNVLQIVCNFHFIQKCAVNVTTFLYTYVILQVI